MEDLQECTLHCSHPHPNPQRRDVSCIILCVYETKLLDVNVEIHALDVSPTWASEYAELHFFVLI